MHLNDILAFARSCIYVCAAAESVPNLPVRCSASLA